MNNKNQYHLILGDSLVELPKFADNAFNVAFTSPPYNRKRNDKYKFYDDTLDDYFEFLCTFTNQLLRICSKCVIVNLQPNYYQKSDVFRYIGKYSGIIQNIVVWEKSNPLPTNGMNITNAYELFVILSENNIQSNFSYTKNHITTSAYGGMPNMHKAVMHPQVSDWFISRFVSKGESVIDPFMGTATTGVSCLKFGINFTGIEISKEYYNESKKRLSEITNIKRLF